MDVVLVFLLALGGVAVGLAVAAAVAWWWSTRARPSSRRQGGDVERQVADALESMRAEQSQHLRDAVATLLSVADDKMGSQSRAGVVELDRRSDAIGQQLANLNAELVRVGQAVTGLERNRAEQHGQLVQGLRETLRSSSEVASTAQSLREALSSSRARGQWGERMADDVLRLAGFTEGISYHRQRATTGGTIPDFTFPLPGGLVLHMDVKFPLDNYLRFLEDDAESSRVQFLRDVRGRIKELGTRGYIRTGETVDYVLLFIPNEAVYGFVHEQDPALADVALRQRVVLCSPFTLFAVLGVVRQAMDSFALQRSTDEILRTLGAFSGQWDKFADHLETVGKRLDSAQRAYEELAGPRRRQLQKMVDRVDDLRRSRGIDAADQPEEIAPAGLPGLSEPVPLRRDADDLRSVGRRLTG